MPIRFAILTAGNIAGQMAETVSHMPEICRWAVAARDLDRAQAFAEKYGFAHARGSYQEVYDDPEVDLVYIGSPHSHHYQQAKDAILAGKHVLCEKPLAPNAALAKELFRLAKEKGVLLAEATWTRYMPFVPALRQVLEEGDIGKPLSMICDFGFPVSGRARLARPELAGGALLDLGIYPLTMAALVFGEAVNTTGLCTKTEEGVDAQDCICQTFAGGETALLHANMFCTLDNHAVIYGEKGQIRLPLFWHCEEFTVLHREGESRTYSFPHRISGYEYEVESAVRAIQAGQLECPEMPAAETIRMLEMMDALRASWGIRYPFE